MALDNATLAQLLGGSTTAPQWSNAAGALGNYLVNQSAPRPLTNTIPMQPASLGGAARTMPGIAAAGTNPFAAANPFVGGGYGAGTGTTAPAALGTSGSALGIDPLVAALLRARLARGIAGGGGGMGGLGL